MPFPRTFAPGACRPPAPGDRGAAARWSAEGARDSKDLDRQPRHLAHVRCDDAVAQHADAADFQFHYVAVLEEAALFVPAAAADRARAQHLARDQGFLERGVGDDVGEAVLHGAAIAVRPGLAVHARLHAQILRIADLVSGGDPGAEGVAGIEILALCRPERALHLDELLVARREVVEHGVAEDVAERVALFHVLAGAADDCADLELVVDDAGVGGPMNLGIVADHAEGIALVVHRAFVPDLGDLDLRRVDPLAADAEEVAIRTR